MRGGGAVRDRAVAPEGPTRGARSGRTSTSVAPVGANRTPTRMRGQVPKGMEAWRSSGGARAVRAVGMAPWRAGATRGGAVCGRKRLRASALGRMAPCRSRASASACWISSPAVLLPRRPGHRGWRRPRCVPERSKGLEARRNRLSGESTEPRASQSVREQPKRPFRPADPRGARALVRVPGAASSPGEEPRLAPPRPGSPWDRGTHA